MTWLEAFTNGPPESPGWIGALISMSPVRLSAFAPPLSLAVIDWSSAVIEPPAVLGRSARAACVADPDDGLADCRRLVGGVHGLQTTRTLELEHGDVRGAVVADHRGRVGLAVADVGDADAGRPVDDVVVGQDLTGRR